MTIPMHFHQAIVTKWLAPTSTLPSRVKATAQAGSLTLSWDSDLDVAENHARVAMALVRKLGWVPELGRYEAIWHAGAVPGLPHGYVFVAGGDVVPVTFAAEVAA